jgi:hypothetical protein
MVAAYFRDILAYRRKTDSAGMYMVRGGSDFGSKSEVFQVTSGTFAAF